MAAVTWADNGAAIAVTLLCTLLPKENELLNGTPAAALAQLSPTPCRRLLADDGNDSPRHPLRLPSMSGRTAFDRSTDAVEDVLGLGGAEAAAVGLLEPSLLPFQRWVLPNGVLAV